MNEEPNPKQTLILWALLAQGGSAAQKDLALAVDRKDRDTLTKAGLLSIEKGKRGAVRLDVTDKGWNWAGEHLGATLPSGRNATKAGTPVLQAWLGKLQAYLRASGVSLADILAAEEPTSEQDAPISAQRDTKTRETRSGPIRAEATSYEALRERVRQAYFEFTGGRSNDGIPLSSIRSKLPDVSREALDAVLKRMHGEPGTTLMSLDNPREMDAERDAAINFKGEMMHVIWVTR